MALVVIASAKGAPGVTTLTVALAALTPGAIAADLDPDGGDLALRYRREDGTPLDAQLGLLSLAASLRRDHTEPAGPTGAVLEHLQVASGGLEVLLGVSGPDQAVGLGPLWSPLGRALSDTDRTVFADCGRIGPASPAMPVLMQADAVILLVRAEVEELAHLRERLRFLTQTLPTRYTGPARIGVILVARERDRAAGPRTEQLLRSSGLAVPVLGIVAEDERGAARVRGLHGGRAGRTTLVRSVRSLLPAVVDLIGYVPAPVAPVEDVLPPRPAPSAPVPPPPVPPSAAPLRPGGPNGGGRSGGPNGPGGPIGSSGGVPSGGVPLGGAYSSPPRLLPPRPELLPLTTAPPEPDRDPGPLPFPVPPAGVISPYQPPPEDDVVVDADEGWTEDEGWVEAEILDDSAADVVDPDDVAEPVAADEDAPETGENDSAAAVSSPDAAAPENGWPRPDRDVTPTALQNWGH